MKEEENNNNITTTKAERLAAKKARKLARRALRKQEEEAKAKGLSTDTIGVNIEASKSVINKPLPEIPNNLKPNAVTICLCYQYKEPAWSKKQHKIAITQISKLAANHNITGRGRCAREGLNCTLTASAENMRKFCDPCGLGSLHGPHVRPSVVVAYATPLLHLLRLRVSGLLE